MDKKRTCCFIGHRDIIHNIRSQLTAQIERLITDNLADSFLIGHQGSFDMMAYSVLKELKKKYPQIYYSIVLAYMPDAHIQELFGEDTLYPDGLEAVPKRFAISKRNEWMIRNSAFMICYVYKPAGGAVRYRNLAVKRGLSVINLMK